MATIGEVVGVACQLINHMEQHTNPIPVVHALQLKASREHVGKYLAEAFVVVPIDLVALTIQRSRVF